MSSGRLRRESSDAAVSHQPPVLRGLVRAGLASRTAGPMAAPDPTIKFIKGAAREARALLADDPGEPGLTAIVQDAVRVGRGMTQIAVREIDRVFRAAEADRLGVWRSVPAFTTYFGDGDLTFRQVTRLRERLHKLHQRMHKQLTIKARPSRGKKSLDCKKGWTAFNRRGFTGTRVINLCPRWFDPDQFDRNEQAAILVHELAHSMGTLWTRDLKDARGAVVRGPTMSRAFAQAEPKDARRNPENLEHAMLTLADPSWATAS